jgi:hypothetical protein
LATGYFSALVLPFCSVCKVSEEDLVVEMLKVEMLKTGAMLYRYRVSL